MRTPTVTAGRIARAAMVTACGVALVATAGCNTKPSASSPTAATITVERPIICVAQSDSVNKEYAQSFVDALKAAAKDRRSSDDKTISVRELFSAPTAKEALEACLLYTSDAADE